MQSFNELGSCDRHDVILWYPTYWLAIRWVHMTLNTIRNSRNSPVQLYCNRNDSRTFLERDWFNVVFWIHLTLGGFTLFQKVDEIARKVLFHVQTFKELRSGDTIGFYVMHLIAVLIGGFTLNSPVKLYCNRNERNWFNIVIWIYVSKTRRNYANNMQTFKELEICDGPDLIIWYATNWLATRWFHIALNTRTNSKNGSWHFLERNWFNIALWIHMALGGLTLFQKTRRNYKLGSVPSCTSHT